MLGHATIAMTLKPEGTAMVTQDSVLVRPIRLADRTLTPPRRPATAFGPAW